MWIRREKATALPAMQADIADEFILHPHRCLLDGSGIVILFLYEDVESRLGTYGDSITKTQYNRPRHCGR